MDSLAWCSHLFFEIVFVCVSIENILSVYLQVVLATCNSTGLIIIIATYLLFHSFSIFILSLPNYSLCYTDILYYGPRCKLLCNSRNYYPINCYLFIYSNNRFYSYIYVKSV